MKKPPELYTIQEPEMPVARNVPRLLTKLPHGTAEIRPAERPETRESAWRDLVRWLAKNPVKDR